MDVKKNHSYLPKLAVYNEDTHLYHGHIRCLEVVQSDTMSNHNPLRHMTPMTSVLAYLTAQPYADLLPLALGHISGLVEDKQ